MPSGRSRAPSSLSPPRSLQLALVIRLDATAVWRRAVLRWDAWFETPESVAMRRLAASARAGSLAIHGVGLERNLRTLDSFVHAAIDLRAHRSLGIARVFQSGDARPRSLS